MSDADKRQVRQRALTVGACAALVAFGGPLVAQRFGDQKAQEAYLADARSLAETIVADNSAAVPARQVSFTNRASPEALNSGGLYTDGLYTQASYSPGSYSLGSYASGISSADAVGGMTLRARDTEAIQGLVSFTLEDLGVEAERGGRDPLDCLARAVYYEARSEDTIGQLAVAEVVMNRVRNPHYPKTVCDVVFQGQYRETGCQFTFTCDGSQSDAPHGEAWDRARDIALHVLLGLNKPVTNRATHYHTDYVNPYWAAGMVETNVIGTHIFYRFPKSTKEWQIARAALEAQDASERAFEAVDPLLVTDGAEPAATLIAVSLEPTVEPAHPPASMPDEPTPL